MKLTAKQRLFVQNYLLSGNGTQAAIAAGYSARTARSIASENLKKPAIAAAVAKGRARQRKRLNAHAEKTIRELVGIVDAKISDLYKPDGTLRPSDEWPKEIAATIREVKQTVSRNGTRRTRVKYHDRLKALKLLGRMVGAFK
jgi:phage terminase small subunit